MCSEQQHLSPTACGGSRRSTMGRSSTSVCAQPAASSSLFITDLKAVVGKAMGEHRFSECMAPSADTHTSFLAN